MAKQIETTGPIRIGPVTIGDKEADVRPFEIQNFEFGRINDHLRQNPAVQRYVVPDALVSSCSQCCMPEINGRPNILGKLFRESRKDRGCRFCPVSMASAWLPARRSDGSYIKNQNGRILSESDMINIAMDGET